jgi:hypothetical protein
MRRRLCFVSWFLFCAVTVPAQNDVVVTDTVITTMHLPKEESISRGLFDTASEQLPVTVRSVPQRLIDSLRAADDFWYASMERKKPKPLAQKESSSGRRLFQHQWFRNLLWVIILTSFCGVVLWYLISSNILLFRKKAKTFGSADDTEETVTTSLSVTTRRSLRRLPRRQFPTGHTAFVPAYAKKPVG